MSGVYPACTCSTLCVWTSGSRPTSAAQSAEWTSRSTSRTLAFPRDVRAFLYVCLSTWCVLHSCSCCIFLPYSKFVFVTNASLTTDGITLKARSWACLLSVWVQRTEENKFDQLIGRLRLVRACWH
uniref:Uncharacterized protein n=1 Tax=Ixodes scapularis TaxID=6945 RepID=A0A4D5RFJ7_IXOSC